MATKSFLNEVELEQAEAVLLPPVLPPDGDERRIHEIGSLAFSTWLADRLGERMSSHPLWHETHPVILGSWARGELAPKSDIDVIFCGSEEYVKILVNDFGRAGLKLRYRMPEDPRDWTKGVQAFDVLALFSAIPVTDFSAIQLREQVALIKKRSLSFRRSLLKAMRVERAARAERYDSISNFLEPNLKYGPGGLRDLEQALAVRQLVPERFAEAEHFFSVLQYYKRLFLLVRQRLHLSDFSSGASEVLSAGEQRPISDWLGFAEPRDFMREIQKGLSRVSFYSDWAFAQATVPSAQIKRVEAVSLGSVAALFDAIESDSSILMQNRVRLAADQVFARRAPSPGVVGRCLARIMDPMADEDALVALFRSRLIDHCIPEFRRINGYVQHDQYHRYTVDAHILQVLRQLKRVCQKPSRGGKLAPFIKALTEQEREILAFAALFHDLAKGRGGDHSRKGIEIANQFLKAFGRSDVVTREVAWIVKEHLALSVAAFRENPRAPRTWRALAERGVSGTRIRLLAVFTVIDILGTNPEAWTSWKDRLLFELAAQLERPETDSMVGFAKGLKSARLKGVSQDRLIDALDPFLVSSLPARALVADLREVSGVQRKGAVPIRVLQVRGGQQTWVRFHEPVDRAGLFLGYVRLLASCGLPVRHASILTDPELGVYDWFEVKSARTSAQVLKLLGAAANQQVDKVYAVKFDQIEVIASDADEWVISFRGRDQSGALAEAARGLFEAGVSIRWAKVHTWGRQIDDVFGVAALTDCAPDELVRRLSIKLGVESV